MAPTRSMVLTGFSKIVTKLVTETLAIFWNIIIFWLQDYDLYLKWYYEKTPTGRKEKEHFEDQLTFKKAVAELAAKEEAKAKKSKKKTAPVSAASSRSAL